MEGNLGNVFRRFEKGRETGMAKTDIKVKLVGTDGNAFALMGRVSAALRRGGRADLVKDFQTEAMSGDYDNLLRVCMDYVDVE